MTLQRYGVCGRRPFVWLGQCPPGSGRFSACRVVVALCGPPHVRPPCMPRLCAAVRAVGACPPCVGGQGGLPCSSWARDKRSGKTRPAHAMFGRRPVRDTWPAPQDREVRPLCGGKPGVSLRNLPPGLRDAGRGGGCAAMPGRSPRGFSAGVPWAPWGAFGVSRAVMSVGFPPGPRWCGACGPTYGPSCGGKGEGAFIQRPPPARCYCACRMKTPLSSTT